MVTVSDEGTQGIDHEVGDETVAGMLELEMCLSWSVMVRLRRRNISWCRAGRVVCMFFLRPVMS